MNTELEFKGDKENDSWIETYTGIKFNVFNIRIDNISIYDIAHSLSMCCRFNGHTRSFLSVAEHCVHTSTLCRPENALVGLLHDAAEAYLSDVPRPIKKWLPEIKRLDDNLTGIIFKRFGCPEQVPEEIKLIDRRLCITEAKQSGMNIKNWRDPQIPLKDFSIKWWYPAQAETQYLRRFFELGGKSHDK